MDRRNNYGKERERKNFIRINFNIRVPNVRVVQDGQQLGIMPTDKARKLAMDAGLDLVETVPHANPPVCQIIDFGKFRYQQSQKEKEQKRKQKESVVELKELRLRPGTQDNDIETKVNAAKKFLAEGKKVLFNLQYKNRENAHKDEGFKVMNKIIAMLTDVAIVAAQPRLEGNRLTCRLEPKTGA